MAPFVPAKVLTRITPFKSFVLQADPDFNNAKKHEPFYEFERRTFTGDNSTKGPYSPLASD